MTNQNLVPELRTWVKANVRKPFLWDDEEWNDEVENMMHGTTEFDVFFLEETEDSVYALIDCKLDSEAFSQLENLTASDISNGDFASEYDEYIVVYDKTDNRMFTCLGYEIEILK